MYYVLLYHLYIFIRICFLADKGIDKLRQPTASLCFPMQSGGRQCQWNYGGKCQIQVYSKGKRLLSGAISFEIMVLGDTELAPWMTCVGMLISMQFFKYFILFMKVQNTKRKMARK